MVEAIAQLCDVAAAMAAARQHELGPWISDGAGRRAECARCGCVAYVRTEAGMAGMIGRAITEPCRKNRHRSAPAT
jgi:hypothetical protein